MNEKIRHFEETLLIPASQKEIFSYVDNHTNFSSHMSKSSWIMGGGHMDVKADSDNGQKVGSHIYLNGKVFGIDVYLDEVIKQYEPPRSKIWQTVGTPRLLVIGSYQMGIEISNQNEKSNLKVFIDYELPNGNSRLLGYLFGGMYAKWCVKQMLNDTLKHFTPQS